MRHTWEHVPRPGICNNKFQTRAGIEWWMVHWINSNPNEDKMRTQYNTR